MRRVSPAERLLQSLGITTSAEIDVEAIAWAVGAKVRYGLLDSCEARIIGFQDRAIITVTQGGDQRRARFSVAHELGHWTYHRGRSSVCRPNEIGGEGNGVAPAERQADVYAADLLMPEYLFRPLLLKERRPTFELVHNLSEAFSTSRAATVRRLVDLGPWPCLIVCHGQQGRRWFHRCKDIPDRWFPRNEIDAESSALDVLYGRASQTTPTIIGADAWFDRWDAERFTVTEESVRSFEGDVLTLLTLKDSGMLD